MTGIGDQPRVKVLRNISGSSLTLATVDTQNLILQVNLNSKVIIDPINTQMNTNIVVNGNFSIQNSNGINFFNIGNTNFIRLQAPSSISANTTYTLPAIYPSVSGQFLSSDTSGILNWVGSPSVIIPSVAPNDSNVVFTISDNPEQLGCLPTAPRTYTLPSAVSSAGQPWIFFNNSIIDSNKITFNASGGSVVDYAIPTQKIIFIPLTTTPTTPANWAVQEAESGLIGYTPSVVGFGSVSNVNFTYKRDRGNIVISGTFEVGTPTSTPGLLSLPSTLSMSNVPSAACGYATTNGGASSPVMYLVNTSTTQFAFSSFNDPNSPIFANALVSAGNFIKVVEVSNMVIGWN